MNALLTAFLCVTSIVGCTTIDLSRAPPADWPKLVVSYESVGFMKLQQVCGNAAFPLFVATACARVNHCKKECTIYHTGETIDAYNKEHELAHCHGMDHLGSSENRDGWETYKEVMHEYLTFGTNTNTKRIPCS